MLGTLPPTSALASTPNALNPKFWTQTPNPNPENGRVKTLNAGCYRGQSRVRQTTAGEQVFADQFSDGTTQVSLHVLSALSFHTYSIRAHSSAGIAPPQWYRAVCTKSTSIESRTQRCVRAAHSLQRPLLTCGTHYAGRALRACTLGRARPRGRAC